MSKIIQDASSCADTMSCPLGTVNIWFCDHYNFALGSCRGVCLNCALTCCKGRFRVKFWFALWSQRAPHSSSDLSLVVEIATEGLDSKENKELGIEITSECPLEGCPSPFPHPRLQPLHWVLFHYKQCLSHVALGNIKKERTEEENKTLKA